MKTLIISSSLSNKSRSYILCQYITKELEKKKISVNKISKELKEMYKNFLNSQMSFQ